MTQPLMKEVYTRTFGAEDRRSGVLQDVRKSNQVSMRYFIRRPLPLRLELTYLCACVCESVSRCDNRLYHTHARSAALRQFILGMPGTATAVWIQLGLYTVATARHEPCRCARRRRKRRFSPLFRSATACSLIRHVRGHWPIAIAPNTFQTASTMGDREDVVL